MADKWYKVMEALAKLYEIVYSKQETTDGEFTTIGLTSWGVGNLEGGCSWCGTS